MSTFDEARCGVFDDSGLEDILDSQLPRKRNLISEEMHLKARELGRLIDQVPPGKPEDIIQHPKMESVRVAAAELLALLDAHIERQTAL
jgi:hypothetical protein